MSRPRATATQRRLLSRVGFALFLALAVGCADLQILSTDTCGNRVLEADKAEECDGEEGCGAPGGEHACRYVCPLLRDSDCPGGFGCGADGVCRAPTGTFSHLAALSTSPMLDLFSGDINHDGCDEVIYTTLRGSTITAFDSRTPGKCSASKQVLPAGQTPLTEPEGPAPVLADLTNDGRPDLVISGKGLYGGGLFVNVPSAAPTVSALFYPFAHRNESTSVIFPLRVAGKDELVILGDLSTGAMGNPGGMKSGVDIIRDPGVEPVHFNAGLPVGASGIVGLATGDLNESNACDEVVVALWDTAKVYSDKLVVIDGCGNGDEFVWPMMPTRLVSLDGGARVREHNASLVLADVDGDGHLDIVVNDDNVQDGKLHVAYGTGTGEFGSDLPNGGAIDNKMSVLDLALVVNNARPDAAAVRKQLVDPGSRFVAGDFDQEHAGVELYPLSCSVNPTVFESPACIGITGSCEAIVADVDADGHPDIVSLDNQQQGITVRRSDGHGHFHRAFFDTTCPPHDLTAADLDDDGITDIAYFDQAPLAESIASTGGGGSGGQGGGPQKHSITALQIAYGQALEAPHPPVEGGLLENAQGLAVGRFSSQAPGVPLLIARRSFPIETPERGSGFAVIESSGRQTFAPYYFSSAMTGLENVAFDAIASGRFGNSREGDSLIGLAVVSHEDGGEDKKLRRLEPHVSGSTLRELPRGAGSDSGIPIKCTACVLVAADVDAPQKGNGLDELIVLNDHMLTIYDAVDAKSDTSKGFEARDPFPPLKHAFRTLPAATDQSLARYTPRPLVADIDGDGRLDIAARADDNALVVLWGRPGGTFDEEKIYPAPGCGGIENCAGYSLALINMDGDAAPEIALLGPDTFELFDNLTPKDHELRQLVDAAGKPLSVPIPKPPATAAYIAIDAADADGDGVKDLLLSADGALITVLRGVPVLE